LNIMSDDAKPTPTTSAKAPEPASESLPTPGYTETSAEAPAPPQPGAVPISMDKQGEGSKQQTDDKPHPTSAVDPTPTSDATEEPQNPLTRKFTDAEWKALKEFRSLLPEILDEAFPDKPNAKSIPITLWRVTIHPDKFVDARVSVILMKFLRARNLNPQEARNMFVSTLRWRDTFKADELLNEKFPEDVFGKLGYVFGKDKEGRPVTYNVYGGNTDLHAVFGDVPRFLRWRVSLMEKGIALLDFENVDQMLQVHDYQGVKMSDRDANSKNAASEATSVFTSHYPEFLYKKFFVNVPTIMTWLFWIFKPLIPSQTFSKMSVVGSGHHTIGKALLPLVDEDELPERYGGKAKAW